MAFYAITQSSSVTQDMLPSEKRQIATREGVILHRSLSLAPAFFTRTAPQYVGLCSRTFLFPRCSTMGEYKQFSLQIQEGLQRLGVGGRLYWFFSLGPSS